MLGQMDTLNKYHQHELSKFLSERRTKSKDPCFTSMSKEKELMGEMGY